MSRIKNGVVDRRRVTQTELGRNVGLLPDLLRK